MDIMQRFAEFQKLQTYMGWSAADRQRLRAVVDVVRPSFTMIVDDFYAEVARHPATRRVMRGGAAQVARLRGTLLVWLEQLFCGDYDRDYVAQRWQVGRRHVEIGLQQLFANAALSRIRSQLIAVTASGWRGAASELATTLVSLNRAIDLDMALIDAAYDQEYQNRLQRSERLVAIGQMAGGIAHELRNPLNVIRTSVFYLLNSQRATPEKQGEHLQRIERQVGVANDVISALSDFAKLPQPRDERVEPLQLIETTLQTMQFAGRVRVQVEPPPDGLCLRGDTRQLQIVLGNLLRNAQDAMPEGGLVRISTTREEADVVLRVSDQGVGIPAEELTRIFDPFVTTKTRGMGLGLAISRAIVENHAGRMSVMSELGRGSTFAVYLPADDPN